MIDERCVAVEFNGERLRLEEHRDEQGAWFAFPDQLGSGAALLSLDQALHARIRPTGTAERLLRTWQRAGPAAAGAWLPFDEPAEAPPVRVRGGAVVIAAGRVLLIRYPPERGREYQIPGGGVESGETPTEAAVRELWEETGVLGTVCRKLAVIYNQGRHEHYFLMTADADSSLTPARGEDLTSGKTPEWVDVHALPDTALWPKRLAWRITHWHAHGWPADPAVLADSEDRLAEPCGW